MRRILLLLLLATLALTACEGRDVVVESVWGRVSPMGAANGAFYMEITNNQETDDALVAVRTGACNAVELHQSQADENGVMRMAPVEGGQIPLPAGETITLQPGGLHVMCIGMNTPFTVGRRIPLTLDFSRAQPLELEAQIRPDAP